jgi:hypothetical protein
VSARLIFFIMAAAAAIGSAVLAGLIVAVVGLSAQVPTATLITLIAGTAAVPFGGVIALAGMAASLFFTAPEPAAPNDTAISLPGRAGDACSAHDAEIDQFREDVAHDGEIRAALEARALVLEAARTESRERAERDLDAARPN